MTVANAVTVPLRGYEARHLRLAVEDRVAVVALNRPER